MQGLSAAQVTSSDGPEVGIGLEPGWYVKNSILPAFSLGSHFKLDCRFRDGIAENL